MSEALGNIALIFALLSNTVGLMFIGNRLGEMIEQLRRLNEDE